MAMSSTTRHLMRKRVLSGLLVRRLLSDEKGKNDGGISYRPPGGSFRSPITILKEELSPLVKKGKQYSFESVIPRHTDVLIIGGGLVGNAVAFFLKKEASTAMDVTIVERDYTYSRASSMLSVGGLRHQFTLPENVQLSMYTTEFLKTYKEHLGFLNQDPPEIQFHYHGYLFLVPEERVPFLEECVNMQRNLGAKTVMLTKSQLAARFPWLNLDGVDAGSYGTEGEGWFDPWQLLQALKAKNMHLGVRYCEGDIVNFRFQDVETHSDDGVLIRDRIEGVDIDHKDGTRYGCNAAMFINCAGPWAGTISKMARIGFGEKGNRHQLPVEPRKRYVYVMHCPDGPTLDTPLVIDTSGAYFRREGFGGHFLCGCSPSENEEPDISNLDVDWKFYNDFIWPLLTHRVPAFENSKLKSAWAGYYDYNTFDQNLVIGPHPYHNNFVFANGMSGHGVQQALAIGRAIFELVAYSEYRTIDLSRFGFQRFISDVPYQEQAIV